MTVLRKPERKGSAQTFYFFLPHVIQEDMRTKWDRKKAGRVRVRKGSTNENMNVIMLEEGRRGGQIFPFSLSLHSSRRGEERTKETGWRQRGEELWSGNVRREKETESKLRGTNYTFLLFFLSYVIQDRQPWPKWRGKRSRQGTSRVAE